MNFKTLSATTLFILFLHLLHAQYIFEDDIRIPGTDIKNQQATGTCWSFGTTSFLESEILRLTGEQLDLSEMYNVRKAYSEKALNYVLRQGTANFGEGGLSHDVLRNVKQNGLMPRANYTGLANGDTVFDHGELSAGLKGYLDAVIRSGHPTVHWQKAVESILDAYLGPAPSSFVHQGKTYDPNSFASYVNIKPDDYYSLTSYTHHPYYQYFILEIPDNYLNGSYFNLMIDELADVIDYSLENGFSVLWDGDVGEKGFSQKEGIALLPSNPNTDSLFLKPTEELQVTAENRQAAFLSYRTTEDHLMHLVGRAKDQNGTVYYIIKNSWGERGKHKGYLYMSESYLKMKTVSITVHKNGIPNAIFKLM
jgi:bleomycin hydrolase